MKKLIIEKGIPMPGQGSGRRSDENVYPFKDMKIGDSFCVPIKEKFLERHGIQQSSIHTSARTWSMYHSLKWKFSTRREGDNIRVWRVK